MINKSLQHLFGLDAVEEFSKKFGLSLKITKECAYLFNHHIFFKVYIHLGTLHSDIYNPQKKTWGWDVDSVIQESLTPEKIKPYLAIAELTAKGIEVEGIEKAQLDDFFANIIIIEHEMSDMMTGDFSQYSTLFKPLSQGQMRELDSVLDNP